MGIPFWPYAVDDGALHRLDDARAPVVIEGGKEFRADAGAVIPLFVIEILEQPEVPRLVFALGIIPHLNVQRPCHANVELEAFPRNAVVEAIRVDSTPSICHCKNAFVVNHFGKIIPVFGFRVAVCPFPADGLPKGQFGPITQVLRDILDFFGNTLFFLGFNPTPIFTTDPLSGSKFTIPFHRKDLFLDEEVPDLDHLWFRFLRIITHLELRRPSLRGSKFMPVEKET